MTRLCACSVKKLTDILKEKHDVAFRGFFRFVFIFHREGGMKNLGNSATARNARINALPPCFVCALQTPRCALRCG